MENSYIANALEVIGDKNVLVNLAAKRASQINKGDHPLIDTPRDAHNRPLVLSTLEIALIEIAEGKVTFEHIEA
ncbi:phosphoribosylaminoimidazole-succinocarboxamide synthase [Lentisphaera araneosa HTCC2155]|uniref:DNA-directed RNA polymerase subunit omega n=1 Tax=Lentisphaera araneosa HTCC2155 TaxID=313628 RepID=A6DHN4_9BACT|nr:DNA-directed RNA polymerase subunit omega [Lentisphaera araneosa]EDM29117.1 phosphoribosylaminoimidazole-succinocarboxamide synthase [Lentisphaera araneosa HTCC2155]